MAHAIERPAPRLIVSEASTQRLAVYNAVCMWCAYGAYAANVPCRRRTKVNAHAVHMLCTCYAHRVPCSLSNRRRSKPREDRKLAWKSLAPTRPQPAMPPRHQPSSPPRPRQPSCQLPRRLPRRRKRQLRRRSRRASAPTRTGLPSSPSLLGVAASDTRGRRSRHAPGPMHRAWDA